MFIVQGHPKGIVTFETLISTQGRGFTQLKDEYTNMDHNCPSTTHHEILNEKHFRNKNYWLWCLQVIL